MWLSVMGGWWRVTGWLDAWAIQFLKSETGPGCEPSWRAAYMLFWGFQEVEREAKTVLQFQVIEKQNVPQWVGLFAVLCRPRPLLPECICKVTSSISPYFTFFLLCPILSFPVLLSSISHWEPYHLLNDVNVI